jgi:hypothetical protein
MMTCRGVVLTVTPSVLLDGQDAFVAISNVSNASPQDYVSISCGPTSDLNDFIDAAYVGPFLPQTITNVRHIAQLLD